MAIRITYDGKTIDLLIDNDALLTKYTQTRKQNRSSSGKIETINSHGIQQIAFASIFDEDTYEDLCSWWSWARQGELWSFAFDTNAAASTTLSASAAAGQKVMSLASVVGLDAGDVCLLQSVIDDEFEIVVLVGGAGETFIVDPGGTYIVDPGGTYLVEPGTGFRATDNLKFSYVAGDILRHYDYWPDVVSVDKYFEPKREGNYYKHVFNFVELN